MSIRGAEPTKMRRVAQDCDPTAYMYTLSGAKDAGIGCSRGVKGSSYPELELYAQVLPRLAKNPDGWIFRKRSDVWIFDLEVVRGTTSVE